MNKIEFVSVDEQNREYSVRTADGRTYRGREYLDSCYLSQRGGKFELRLDLARAEERIVRNSQKFK